MVATLTKTAVAAVVVTAIATINRAHADIAHDPSIVLPQRALGRTQEASRSDGYVSPHERLRIVWVQRRRSRGRGRAFAMLRNTKSHASLCL
mgnify:CR=1 FL=1